jgi:tetratricopeptide (TPR) repeat protein
LIVTKERIFILLLIVSTCLVYANSFTGPFIYDDEPNILQNPYLRSLWPLDKALIAPPKSGLDGRPIASLSLALTYALFGYRVWGYHLINLLIHIFAGLTLYGIVRRSLLTERLKGRFGKDSSILAWVVAVLWLLHPLQTESVTYIIQRIESLMGLFFLLTLYTAIRASQSPRPGIWLGLSVVCCALGMGTKEVMIVAPVMVLLFDYLFIYESLSVALKQRAIYYGALAGCWIILGLLLMSGARSTGAGFDIGIGPVEYAANQCRIILHYIRLSFWPAQSCLDYKWELLKDWGQLLPFVGVISIITIIGIWGLYCRKGFSYPVLWFLGTLAPTSSFIPVANPAFEHRMYLPLAGLIALVVVYGYIFLSRLSRRFGKIEALSHTGLVLVFIVASAFGIRTFLRNRDYKSVVSIWQANVEAVPENPYSRVNLGKALFLSGRAEEAIVQFIRALEIAPQYAEAHNNLGVVLKSQGKIEQAIEHYKAALRTNPDYPDALFNLGNAYLSQGETEQAVYYYNRAVLVKPDFAEAHNRLADALKSQGKFEQAEFHYRKALELRGENK